MNNKFSARLWAACMAVCLSQVSATPSAPATTPTPPAAAKQAVQPAQKLPEISATAFLIQDAQSGQMLAEHAAQAQIDPAGFVQLMTAYLAFQALEEGRIKAAQQAVPSDRAWKTGGQRMYLKNGVPVRIGDLIKGLVVLSANDAAITLAETVGGSEAAFVQMMNRQAEKLGMRHTHFANPTGLPADGQLSTAADLALLSAAIIRDFPQYYPVYSMKSLRFNQIEQPNRNLLLFRDHSIDGLKSTQSPSSGYSLITSGTRHGRRMLAVVIGTDSAESRAAESSKLLNWAWRAFSTPRLYTAGEKIAEVSVYKGAQAKVDAGFLEDVFLTLPHQQGKNLRLVLETKQPIIAPVAKGQPVGMMKVMYREQVMAEYPVVALNEVPQGSWFRRFWDNLVIWFGG